MSMKLNQVIAVVSGKKTRAQKALTDSHHGWQPGLLNGAMRKYTPLDADDADAVPTKKKPVQLNVAAVIRGVRDELSDLWDLVARQEKANTGACADVVVDDIPVLKQVPVTVLLFLEKQLTDLRSFAEKMPTLSTEHAWGGDARLWQSDPIRQTRTRKVQSPIVLYDATPEHPAQTQLVTEDKLVGHYDTTLFSGAMQPTEQAEIVVRIDELRDAVKSARESANCAETEPFPIAKQVFDFIFPS